jgi:hypothetical protein
MNQLHRASAVGAWQGWGGAEQPTDQRALVIHRATVGPQVHAVQLVHGRFLLGCGLARQTRHFLGGRGHRPTAVVATRYTLERRDLPAQRVDFLTVTTHRNSVPNGEQAVDSACKLPCVRQFICSDRCILLRQIFQTSGCSPMTASARHTASYYAASSLPQPDYPVLQGRSGGRCVRGRRRLFRAEHRAGAGRTGLSAWCCWKHAQDRLGRQRAQRRAADSRRRPWPRPVCQGVIGSDGVRQMKLMGLEAVEIVRQRVERFQISLAT